MKQESRYVKDIIKSKFPDAKVFIRYQEAVNYVDTSDKIIVSIEDNSQDIVSEVIALLKSYTKGIKVYKKGDVVSIWEGGTPEIRHPNGVFAVLKPDLLEFIEVGMIKSNRGGSTHKSIPEIMFLLT